jgi:hypothetical protein
MDGDRNNVSNEVRYVKKNASVVDLQASRTNFTQLTGKAQICDLLVALAAEASSLVTADVYKHICSLVTHR